jgi:ubiquilin
MGPPPSQEQMIEMLSNPAFSQMMNEALQNPAMIDMMIQQNPQLREMGPAGRQFLQSEQFRRMVTDPQSLRAMGQLQAAMGMGPFGGAGGGGQEAFPAPGITTTTPAENREAGSGDSQDNTQTNATTNAAGTSLAAPGSNPFAALFGMPPPTTNQQNTGSTSPPTSQPQNPFAALLGMPSLNPNTQQQPGQQAADPSNSPPSNPFLNIQNNPLFQNPDLMNQFVQAMGGGAGGGGGGGGSGLGGAFGGNAAGATPFANLANVFGGGGIGGPASPPDNRPPEERYATQLRQLNEMGFFDFNRNIQALQRSGGDVNGALEWLFSQP